MFDAYTRRARLAPAAVAAVPALVLLGGGLISPEGAESVVALGFGAVGVVICGLVRDAGRRLQDGLWRSWGGAPTVRRLRWRDASDPGAMERLHRLVAEVTGEPLPTSAEEDADPQVADRRYAEAVAVLRELTRKRQDFPLVAEENAEYGFRRNCLGLRPVAMAVAGAVLGVSAGLLVAGGGEPRFYTGGAVALVALAWWWLVRPDWVRRAAELYADRLLEAVETLRRQAPG